MFLLNTNFGKTINEEFALTFLLKKHLPSTIENEHVLNELLSAPSPQAVEVVSQIDGDFILLGVNGKIGISLAHMLVNACKLAGVKKRIVGVSRFSDSQGQKILEKYGIETIQGNLLDRDFLARLPLLKNVIFMAGMKFGSSENLPLMWAMNSYLPGLVAEKFKESRIVSYSTGCVYPLVRVDSGGSRENDAPEPVGEYGQSCLGRDRMFQFISKKEKTPVAIIRLNYAVEMRYGVLVDIALQVKNEQIIHLNMGHFNAIWQGDANAMVLQSLAHCTCLANIINITGPETLSVRYVAEQFGEIFGKKPQFAGIESKTALLSNASKAFGLFGYPQTPLHQIIQWTADWIMNNQPLLQKPTHFEVRDGNF